jgi:hypothetical protein
MVVEKESGSEELAWADRLAKLGLNPRYFFEVN